MHNFGVYPLQFKLCTIETFSCVLYAYPSARTMQTEKDTHRDIDGERERKSVRESLCLMILTHSGSYTNRITAKIHLNLFNFILFLSSAHTYGVTIKYFFARKKKNIFSRRFQPEKSFIFLFKTLNEMLT